MKTKVSHDRRARRHEVRRAVAVIYAMHGRVILTDSTKRHEVVTAIVAIMKESNVYSTRCPRCEGCGVRPRLNLDGQRNARHPSADRTTDPCALCRGAGVISLAHNAGFTRGIGLSIGQRPMPRRWSKGKTRWA